MLFGMRYKGAAMQILRCFGHIWIGALLLSCTLVGVFFAVRVIAPFTSTPPIVVESIPADQSQEVLLRAQIQVRFDQAMNPRSVERALRIEPAIEVAVFWDDTNTTLTISPTHTLQSETNYRISFEPSATNKWFRQLEQSYALAFQTAPAPAVVAMQPANGAQQVALDTAIHIRFSRAIVSSEQLQQAQELPELRFEPEISGHAIWLDPTSVLFRPDQPLAPGQSYTARLLAELDDLGGGTLGRDVTWSFETRIPKPVSLTPNLGARWVAGRTPLVVQLDTPISLDQVDPVMTITPTIEGTLDSLILPDATQVITFTPSVDWQVSTTYSAALAIGKQQRDVALWSFTTTPPPALIGRFPGEGQILLANQDVRLIFNMPIEASALEQSLRFEPDAGPIRVSVSGSEARISADFQASTDYTLIIPADLQTQAGLVLGREYQIRFSTASAKSSIKLTTQAANFTMFVPDQTISLPIQRMNVSALNLSLYQLDAATTIRALSFAQRDWLDFQPERYAQPLVRTWSLALADDLNRLVDDSLQIALDEETPLAAGMYYLKLETPEGQRADVLLLGARARLSMQQSGNTIMVWAVDALSAQPIADLSLRLYQDQALIQQGRTNADGVWQIERPQGASNASFIAISSEPELSIVSSAWNESRETQTSETYRIWLTSDRNSYQVGETIELAGVVRRVQGQQFQMPLGRFPVQMNLRSQNSGSSLESFSVDLDASGIISTSLELSPRLPAGMYTLSATTGGASTQIPLFISQKHADALQIDAQTPTQQYHGDRLQVPISVRSSTGLPVSQVVISWTLTIEPQDPPHVPAWQIGDAGALQNTSRQVQSGTLQSNPQGQALLSWDEPISATVPLRYSLYLQVSDSTATSSSANYRWRALPADRWLGIALDQQVLSVGDTVELALQAFNSQLDSQAASIVTLQVYRQIPQEPSDEEPNAPLLVREQRLFQRQLATDTQGQANYAFQIGLPGQYRIAALLADAQGRTSQTVSYFWASSPNYMAWPAQSKALINDKTLYQLNDTAHLLLTAPHRDGVALISRVNQQGFRSEVQQVKAGVPISLTLSADDLPNVRVSVLLMQSSTNDEVLPAISASSLLSLQAPAPTLELAIESDQIQYLPDSTAIITLTTRDTSGQAVPARVMFAALQQANGIRSNLPNTFSELPAAIINTAQAFIQQMSGQAAQTTRPSPLLPFVQGGKTLLWDTKLETNAQGELTIRLPIPPNSQQINLRAWAIHELDQFAQAELSLQVPQALELAVLVPEVFRQGDELYVLTTVRNTSAISQTADLLWRGQGVNVDAASATQTVFVGPYQTTQVAWPLLAGSSAEAKLVFELRQANQSPVTYQQDIELLPPILASELPVGVQQVHEFLDPASKQAVRLADLSAGQYVYARVVFVVSETQRDFYYKDHLPSGTRLVSNLNSGFAQQEIFADRIVLAAPELAPGLYQYDYLLQVIAQPFE